MKKEYTIEYGREIDCLTDCLSDEVRHVIYRVVQERGSAIREESIWRRSASQPEFALACQVAEDSGLRITY
jgi:hypothetical protein